MDTCRITEWAAQKGYRVAWGPWSAYLEARDELEKRRRDGELDEALFDNYIAPALSYGKVFPSNPEGAWLVVAAVPRPAHTVTFTVRGKPFPVLLPPTYLGYRETGKEIARNLAELFPGGAGHFEPLSAALKSVAARLGLTTYGRNNIAYTDGLGSYFQIVGCWTEEDLSQGASEPREPLRLAECEGCDACDAACPTDAIVADRFLLRAERCVTYFNERPADFPAWIPAQAHRCLIGCMLCQAKCPANSGKLIVEDSNVHFSEEETRAVLDPAASGDGEAFRSAEEKLSSLCMTEPSEVIWRNLRTILKARGIWPSPARKESKPT